LSPEVLKESRAFARQPNRFYAIQATTNPENRHFDRSCSQPYREQRSGEIRFLTQSLPAATARLLLPLHLFFAFSAQKSHVKSQNHLNPTNKTRSSWHFS
jgi:hypothetical protein